MQIPLLGRREDFRDVVDRSLELEGFALFFPFHSEDRNNNLAHNSEQLEGGKQGFKYLERSLHFRSPLEPIRILNQLGKQQGLFTKS